MKTPYLSVIVKGNRFQAAQAAGQRGIPFAFVREATYGGHTVGRVGVQHLDRIACWLAEDPQGVPFPIGACLLYTHVEGDHA